MPHNWYPSIDSLSEADADRLRAVTAENLHAQVLNQFTDDQAQCLDVEINGVQVALQWISERGAAAFYFYEDSPSARAIVLEVIRQELAMREQWRAEQEEEGSPAEPPL